MTNRGSSIFKARNAKGPKNRLRPIGASRFRRKIKCQEERNGTRKGARKTQNQDSRA